MKTLLATPRATPRAASGANAGGVVPVHDGCRTTVGAVPRVVRDLQAGGSCPGRIDDTGRVVAP